MSSEASLSGSGGRQTQKFKHKLIGTQYYYVILISNNGGLYNKTRGYVYHVMSTTQHIGACTMVWYISGIFP